MKKKDLRIKKKQQYLPFYIGFCIIMFGLGLFCLFLPYIAPYRDTFSATRKAVYLALGGLGTVYFAFLTSYLVFQLVSPPTALLISSKGLTDFTTSGKGAGFIPKDAIISLKVFGIKKKLYLGIKVSDDIVPDLGLKPAAKREIQTNISSGMPAVIIKQSDVNVPIRKLLRLIVDRLATPAAKTEEATAQKKENHSPTIEAQAVQATAESQKTSPVEQKKQPEDKHLSKQIFGTEAKISPEGNEDKKSKITVLTTDEKKSTENDDDVKIFNEDKNSADLVTENNKSEETKSAATIKSVDELLEQLLNSTALEKPASSQSPTFTNAPIKIEDPEAKPIGSSDSAKSDPIESEYFAKLFSDGDKR